MRSVRGAGKPQVGGDFGDRVEALDPAKSDFAGLVRTDTGGANREARLGAEAAGTMDGRRRAKVQEVARKFPARPGHAGLVLVSEDGRIVRTTTKGADFGGAPARPTLASTGLALFDRTSSDRGGLGETGQVMADRG